MYKALIIDDERPTRQAITALGRWDELGVEVPFEASNGRTGLEIMYKHYCDIVLVDMKMPVMDGMEFIKTASSEFPNSKYIIVSGYSDFEYARKAIQYKVNDYLLKPVVEEELNNVIKRVVRELDNERKIAESNPMIHITKILATESAMSEQKQFYYGIIMLYVVNQFNGIINTFNNNFNFSEIINDISTLINDYWDPKSNCFAIVENPKQILLTVTIPYDFDLCNDESNIRDYTSSCTRTIIKKLTEKYGIYTIAGVGSFSMEIQSIYNSYLDALEILNNVNLLDNSRHIYTDFEADITRKWSSVIDKKELFTRAFEHGNMQYAKDMIEKYFASIKRDGFLCLDDLKRTTMDFIIVFREIAIENGVKDYKKILPQIGDNSVFHNFNSPGDFSNYIYSLFEVLFENACKSDTLSINDIVLEIKIYIDENYSGDISLTLFSSKYHITKEYLSKQFKDQFGYGIYEYALRVRMSKAAEMMLDPEIKVREISDRVGYTDNNYFSRAFKNFYGVSPTEYRKT